jgi:N-acyl-D-amino-acid deacylase
LADGQAKIVERLHDRATREKIVNDMLRMLSDLGQENYDYAIVATYKPNTAFEGKSIHMLNIQAERPDKLESEIDLILEMIEKGGAQMVYHSMGNEDVERILRYPNTAIASDGGVREFGIGMPHPRSYGTNARVLAEFVRNRNVLTLEDAIRRMTSLPAGKFRLRDRGLLQEGLAADLVLFDPAKVQDKATFQNPHQYTEGFDYVIVNGTVMVEDGKLRDVRPGVIIRSTVQ